MRAILLQKLPSSGMASNHVLDYIIMKHPCIHRTLNLTAETMSNHMNPTTPDSGTLQHGSPVEKGNMFIIPSRSHEKRLSYISQRMFYHFSKQIYIYIYIQKRTLVVVLLTCFGIQSKVGHWKSVFPLDPASPRWHHPAGKKRFQLSRSKNLPLHF